MATRERREERDREDDSESRALGAEEQAALLAALTTGLEDALEGVEVLDRSLVLDEGARADLAAVDPAGRLVLVQVAGPDSGKASLALLDLVAWANENLAVLCRHLGSPALRPELAPRILVVVTEHAEPLRRRLLPLDACGVELFGLRTIQSAGGERVYLAPLLAHGQHAGGQTVDPADRFVGALPGELRALGQLAVERIARLDEELVARADQESIAWRFRGEALVRLEHTGERLRATLGSEHELRPLRSEADLEELLEGALERLVPLFERDPGAPRLESGARAQPPLGFPAPGEPLLSPEELEAFRS